MSDEHDGARDDQQRDEGSHRHEDGTGAHPGEGDEEERRPAGGPWEEDEDAIWARLVAAFDEEPAVEHPWPDAEELGGRRERGEDGEGEDREHGRAEDGGDEGNGGFNTTRSIILKAGPLPEPLPSGPRDYSLAHEEDEGHYVPPPPPPLPRVDTTTKFAWLAVLGGPLLLFAFAVFQQPVPWWGVTLGVGGFLGGFGTLVARMKDGGDEEDDPNGGAVV